jgi:hypothetical protein
VVRLVLSQCSLLPTSALVLVNATFHDTVFETVTETVVLLVDFVTGDASSTAMVSVGRSTVPVQFALSYRVKASEPLSAVPPSEVIVAESFGSQVCAEVADVVSVTVKHSLALESLEFV